jgi:hypothetical protein
VQSLDHLNFAVVLFIFNPHFSLQEVAGYADPLAPTAGFLFL